MLSYTVYSEAGGVGKTTLASNLAVAHARAGLDVVVVPLDPQDGNLSRLFGIDDDRDSDDADSLVHHMINRPRGEFNDLIRTVEGIDIVPEHNILSRLDEFLRREQEQAEQLGESFGTRSQLLRVLREEGVNERYDVLICDPPATEGPHLYNAINATRSLVVPLEASAKGRASVEGLESLVAGLEEHLNISVGVLATVPLGFKETRDQKRTLEQLDYAIPEVIGERAALFEGCWEEQCSAFKYVREHRSRQRDYEMETLAQLDSLARYLEEQANISAPKVPESGDIDHQVLRGESA